MARQAGMWTDRQMQIRAFIESGAEVIRIPVDEDKEFISVNNSIQATIRRHPHFAARVEVFNRRGRVYLARKDK